MQMGVGYYHLKRNKQPGVLYFRLNVQEVMDELGFFFFLNASRLMMSPLTLKDLEMFIIVFWLFFFFAA